MDDPQQGQKETVVPFVEGGWNARQFDVTCDLRGREDDPRIAPAEDRDVVSGAWSRRSRFSFRPTRPGSVLLAVLLAHLSLVEFLDLLFSELPVSVLDPFHLGLVELLSLLFLPHLLLVLQDFLVRFVPFAFGTFRLFQLVCIASRSFPRSAPFVLRGIGSSDRPSWFREPDEERMGSSSILDPCPLAFVVPSLSHPTFLRVVLGGVPSTHQGLERVHCIAHVPDGFLSIQSTSTSLPLFPSSP